MEYRTSERDDHLRREELQWARILSAANPARSMALVFIQKLCTACHEFGPAWEAGALDSKQAVFFRTRLGARIHKVLDVLERNDLSDINGREQLAALLDTMNSAETLAQLAELTDRIHAVNHTLCDALEGENGSVSQQPDAAR